MSPEHANVHTDPKRDDNVLRRFVLVTLMLPAVVTIIGLAVQLAADPPASLPAYWRTGTGGPVGWEPTWLQLGLTIVLGFGLPAAFGLSSLRALRDGDRSPTFRLLGAQALGISVLLTIITSWRLLESLETAPPDHRQMWIPLVAAVIAGVAAAVIGWFLQPGSPGAATASAAAPLDLAPSQRATWIRTVSLPLPAIAVITAVTTIVAIKASFGWLAGDPDAVAAILTVVALLLIALLASTSTFHVRVDARGLSVRSAFGLPRFRIVPHQVHSVAVLDARSLGIPGSWGIRIRPSRATVIMQPTTGIQVTRRDGRKLYVTVDDAATGAALLKTYATRANAEASEN